MIIAVALLTDRSRKKISERNVEASGMICVLQKSFVVNHCIRFNQIIFALFTLINEVFITNRCLFISIPLPPERSCMVA